MSASNVPSSSSAFPESGFTERADGPPSADTNAPALKASSRTTSPSCFRSGSGCSSSYSSTAGHTAKCIVSDVRHVANHALVGFVELRSKGVGLDMALKSACWTLRLVSALSEKGAKYEDVERLEWSNKLVSAIIDERMMFNQWKWLSTGRNAVVTAMDGPASVKDVRSSDTLRKAAWFFTVLTYFFRTFEQGQGDIGFWNRFYFTNWNSKVHSRRYKMFKSFSLTMSLIVEGLRIFDYQRQIKKAHEELKSPLSVAATPVTGSPGFDHPVGITNLHEKLRKSILLFIRNVGDMIIYFQWIESYKPNKVLASLCGMYSGFVGVYLVWTDNREEIQKKERARRLLAANTAAMAKE